MLRSVIVKAIRTVRDVSKTRLYIIKLLVKANKDTVRGVNLHTRADP